MLIMDMPNVPPQSAPVLMQVTAVAQNTPSKPDLEPLYGSMGVCLVSPTLSKMGIGTNSSRSNGLSLYPQGTALRRYPDSDTNVDLQMAVDNASVQILQQPEHGTIKTVPKSDDFYYVPQQGYTGNDKVVFLVNIGGHNVKTVYYIKVVDSELNSKTFDALYAKYCPPPTDWIISSSTTDANSIASLIPQNWLSFVQPHITITFADLQGGAIGPTSGNTITLDDNAAGNGWFIDPTPGSNEEFLPTSTPNEWATKADSVLHIARPRPEVV